MIESQKNIINTCISDFNKISDELENTESFGNKSIKKMYERFLNKEENSHYYYTDNANLEWEFTEINDSNKIFISNVVLKAVKNLE